MKKILLIHNEYQNTGGEDISVLNEIPLLEKNFIVETLFFSNKKVKFWHFIYFLTNNNLDSKKKLKMKLKSFQPDVVYIHNTWFVASLGIFKLLKNYDVKVFVKLHNFRSTCTLSFFNFKHIKNKKHCPACGQYYKDNIIFNKYFKESYLKSFLVIWFGKKYFKIIKKFDLKILVLTEFHRNFLIQFGINSKKITVLPNYIHLSEKLKVEKKNTIVYAGRISKEKGVEDLVKTFILSNLENYKLEIIGSGPELKKLKKTYNKSNIIFYGEVKNEKAIEIISKATAVVTATHLYEGQPTLLCEASSLNVLSIFPKTGGIMEFFPQNYEFSFKQFDYDDLFEKLALLKNTKNVNQIAEENKKFIDNKLKSESLINKFNKIIGN